MDFTNRFKELLEDNEISAKRLSKIINVDHSSMYEYLKGSLPSIDNAVKLANYFHCTLNYIFGLDFEMKGYDFGESYNPKVFFVRYTTLLKEKNISHHKLCNETGVNKSSYWLWSKGSTPKSDNLLKIAKYLDCSMDYLVGRSESRF